MLADVFVSTIPPRIQGVAVIGSLIIFGVVIHLIRKEKLKEGYSIIWFLIGLLLVILATFTQLLDILAHFVGIAYSPAALFLVLTSGLFLLALHFSVLVSKHDKRIRELAQENAWLKQAMDRREEPLE